ncbi:MAG: VOC family protein [Rhodothermales bacterium]|nr:VOC family protein [Rhodothermales bacterium]
MLLKKPLPDMMVDDVNATVAFYRDVLGFDLVMTVPDRGRLDWALLRRGGAEVLFQDRQRLADELPVFAERPVGGALTFYFNLDGIDGLYEQVRGRLPLVQDLRPTFYGTREFSVQDNNGFILTFAEDGVE